MMLRNFVFHVHFLNFRVLVIVDDVLIPVVFDEYCSELLILPVLQLEWNSEGFVFDLCTDILKKNRLTDKEIFRC